MEKERGGLQKGKRNKDGKRNIIVRQDVEIEIEIKRHRERERWGQRRRNRDRDKEAQRERERDGDRDVDRDRDKIATGRDQARATIISSASNGGSI